MARKGGNPDLAKYQFKKGDPRINRTGLQKKTPLLKKLMDELLGHTEEEEMTDSELALVVKALIAEAKTGKMKTMAAKEILDRVYGKPAQTVKVDGPPTQIVWNETKTYKGDGKKKGK